MGLIRNAIVSWLMKANPAGVNVSDFRANRPYRPPDKLKELVKRYTGWVYACAHLNAINCAQTPLRVYFAKESNSTQIKVPHRKLSKARRQYIERSPSTQQFVRKAVDVEEICEHPFLDLMNSVNPFFNQFDLLETLFMFMDLTGNEFWLLKNNPLGVPSEIWPLFPQFMSIIPDKQTFISGYEYKIANVVQKFNPEEIVHFKNPNPIDAFWGLGPLRAAILAADLSTGYNTHETTLMKNGARPDMALVLPVEAGTPGEPEMKKLLGRWRQRHGRGKQGGLAILTGGAELKQVTLSQREMEFLKGRKATREEIAAIFGVPLSKLTTENVNLANAKVGETQYGRDTILPRLRKAEQKINEQIIPVYEQPGLFVAFDNPVPDDQEQRLKERTENIKVGYSNINEERAVDGLEPVPWGEEPGPITSQGGVQDEPTNSDANADSVPKKRLSKKAPRTLSPLVLPSDYVSEMFVNAMERHIAKIGEAVAVGIEAEYADKAVVKSPIDDLISNWLDIDDLDAELQKTLMAFETGTLGTAGRAAIGQITSEVDFDVLNPRTQATIRTHTQRASVHINRTQTKRVRKVLSEGIAGGEGAAALRKRLIDEHFNEDLTRKQAERIARTEAIWAWNEGAVQGYKQSGVVTKKEWLTAEDERLCQFCEPMNGVIVGIEVNFFDRGEDFRGTEGGIMKFDYDNIGHPPLHPQCRCTIIPVVEDF